MISSVVLEYYLESSVICLREDYNLIGKKVGTKKSAVIKTGRNFSHLPKIALANKDLKILVGNSRQNFLPTILPINIR